MLHRKSMSENNSVHYLLVKSQSCDPKPQTNAKKPSKVGKPPKASSYFLTESPSLRR